MNEEPVRCQRCGASLPSAGAVCPNCEADLTQARPSFPSIPGCRIKRLLGRGGMGVVYLAEDPSLQRQVAIKFLPAAPDAPSGARERFLREARAMARMRHPRIVPVHSYGENDEGAYLVMEFVPGGTLASKIAKGGMPVPEAVSLVRAVAEALESASAQGILHRDIKPSNILLDEEGEVSVADFGLAKQVDSADEDSLTMTGAVLGTPHYLAPEVAQGEEATAQSDMYSLGIVFYELLTGEKPFQGRTLGSVLVKQIQGNLPSIQEKRPDVPEGVARLIETLTAKEPSGRPASFRSIIEALDSSHIFHSHPARALTQSRSGKRAIFMDRHDIDDAVPPEDVAAAHRRDLEVQDKYDAKAMTYWFDQDRKAIFCLIEAPDREAVQGMHREAHGMLANEVIEVKADTVQSFLGRITDPEQVAEKPIAESAFRAIMVTDMENAAELANRLGDRVAMQTVRAHDDLVRAALSEHGGAEVKRRDDGFLASFPSISLAVECGIAIQKATAAHNSEHPEQPIHIRIGLSAGEPVAEKGELFGTAVNLAARTCEQAEGGHILAIQVVRDLCIGKTLPFVDHGEARLRGFQEPVKLYDVAWSD
jgi:class 3 adenylate cyclase/predicted Ser/Thr protein kinase